jgi:glycerol dehydrogenase
VYDFSDKQIVVCGGANGLGAYFSEEFSKANGSVAVLDLVAPRLKGPSFHFICDVSNYDDTFSVLEKIVKEKGKVDALINCIRLKGNPTPSFSPLEKETWEKGLRINLGTYFNASSAVCELMKDKETGCSIINISSISASLISSDQTIDYHCAKAAINQLTRFLAVKYGPYNIRVNSVLPGLISHHAPEKASSHPSASLYQRRARSIPLKRSGGPQDVANLVLFLASDFSNFITGQDIVIDGGLSICEQLYLLSVPAAQEL